MSTQLTRTMRTADDVDDAGEDKDNQRTDIVGGGGCGLPPRR